MPLIRHAHKRRGFTLIELMIVVAIIGILAAIAIPKFADLVRKAKEGQTKGSLGSLRSALSIYYSDMEGQYPSDSLPGITFEAFASLTANGKYIASIPTARTPDYHSDTSTYTCANSIPPFPCPPPDNGGWAYTDNPLITSYFGYVMVNCFHSDTKGTQWSLY